MKAHSKNTILDERYAYPNEENIGYEIKKELVLNHIDKLPIRKYTKIKKR